MPAEKDPSKAPKDSEIKYVLSGQPTGWWAMSKDVREFDVEKVQSCKEDIDTLLVFAGLFSAVLSAFLVAAYPNLQPAPSDRMIHILERVAAQTAGYNLNFTDGRLIAANVLPSSPPPFQVSDEAIRVNVLWFASLILSLVTASFGMLVKQWLREYLANEDPSALHRLRLRHFREPQMKAWMVYEIAGLLPILLHISLGLFFVGLCYFTSSVHASIGHTTIPLVVGWALCFFTATALPIFFPRCPYKIAFVKVLIMQLHRIALRIANWIELRTYGADDAVNQLPSRNQRSRVGNLFIRISSLGSLVADILRSISYTAGELVEKIKGFSWKNLCRRLVVAVQTIPNEAALVGTSAADLAILVSVDAIQGNDEMLGTAIPEALHYTRPSPRPSDVVHFIIQLLEHRVPTSEPSGRVVGYWPFRDMFPLEALRPQARDNVNSILFDHIDGLSMYGGCGGACFSKTNDWSETCQYHVATFCAFFLVISMPVEALHSSAISFLKDCFDTDRWAGGNCLRWFGRGMVSIPGRHAGSLEKDQARVITAVNSLVTAGYIQLSLDQCGELFTNILYPNDADRARSWDFASLSSSFPRDTWRWPDNGDPELRFSCMVFWINAMLGELDGRHTQHSPVPVSSATQGADSSRSHPEDCSAQPTLENALRVAMHRFHNWWTQEYTSISADSNFSTVYGILRKMIGIAFRREDTALLFIDALLSNLEISSVSQTSSFRGRCLLKMLELSLGTDRESLILHVQPDPAVIHAVLRLASSKLEKSPEVSHVVYRLQQCQLLEFLCITANIPPDLREETRIMFSSMATSIRASFKPAAPVSDYGKTHIEWAARHCILVMRREDSLHGLSDCPHSEEDSIFPDTLLDVLLELSGDEDRDSLPRAPKPSSGATFGNRKAATVTVSEASSTNEPNSNAAIVADRASIVDQASNVPESSGPSGGGLQRAYAAQDTRQTEAVHEEDEKDVGL